MGGARSRCRAALLLGAVVGTTSGTLCLAAPYLLPASFTVEDALTATLAWVLVCCGGWWGLTATLMAAEAVATGGARRSSALAPQLVRTLVLATCGAGLTAGLAVPALADTAVGASQTRLLDGLALPDRVTGAAHGAGVRPAGSPSRVVTVRRGDTLWALARVHATDWPTLYAANRREVGPDPDLIRPGMRLTLPSTDQGRHP